MKLKLNFTYLAVLWCLVSASTNSAECFNVSSLIDNVNIHIPKPSIIQQFLKWIWGSPATLTINSLDTNTTKNGLTNIFNLFSKKVDVMEINPWWGKYSLAVPLTGLEGIVVRSEPLHACEFIKPPPNYPSKEELLIEQVDNSTQKQKWFLVADDSGDCDFETKIQNADMAGYDLIIIVNTNSSEPSGSPLESENATNTDQTNSFIGNIKGLIGFNTGESVNILSCSVGKENGILLEDIFAYPEPYTATLMDLRKLDLPKSIGKIVGVSAGAVVVLGAVSFAAYKGIKRFILSSPSTTGNDEEEDRNHCLICNESFTDTDDIRMLPRCLHCFHYKCLKTKTVGNHVHCPVCDKSIKVPTVGKQTRFSAPVKSYSHVEDASEKTPLLSSGSIEKPKFHCKICEILATPTTTADNSRTSSPTFRHSPMLTRTMSEQVDTKNLQKSYSSTKSKLIDTEEDVIEDGDGDAETEKDLQN